MKARLLTGLSMQQPARRSEFGWKVAVDLKANADFNERWSCPGHMSLPFACDGPYKAFFDRFARPQAHQFTAIAASSAQLNTCVTSDFGYLRVIWGRRTSCTQCWISSD
jgi:hypothetical protein